MSTPVPILTVTELEKSYGAKRVLRGVTLTVNDDDRIGLVGVNGCGKSTLLRLMVGVGADGGPAGEGDELDAGQITRRRGLRLEYVPQEPRLPGGETVAVVLRQGLAARGAADGTPPEELEYELRGLSAALELPPGERRVDELSIGERRRVALARALLTVPDLLALDEPTNHLDGGTVSWLEGRLRGRRGALVLVTHDRYFLDRVATRIVEIDRGVIHGYDGNYSYFLAKQADRLAAEGEHERVRAAYVRRELDWIRRKPEARRTKQQARIDRFDAAAAAAPSVEDRRGGALTLRLPRGPRLGKTIVELRGVGHSLGGKLLFRGLDLVMKGGDRIGIVGVNGAGKTTLVRTILGELEPDQGEVEIGVNTRFAFLDQGRRGLDAERTVLEEVAGDSDTVYLEDGPIHVRSFLRMMLFDDATADTRIGSLSGGERNRVELARLLREGGNVIVLDEPTNDLDLMTLGVLEEALIDFSGCALIVSHDRWFLDRVATGILAFEGAGRVVFHEGDYSTYLARRALEQRSDDAAAAAARADGKRGGGGAVPPGTAPASGAPVVRKLTFSERREVDGMEAAIACAEVRVVELEGKLEDPAYYRDRPTEVPALVAALDAARAEIDRLYARWQELEARA